MSDVMAAQLGGSALDMLYNSLMTSAKWGREDNAYQRMVKDLERAGLNPVLAAGRGGSATSDPVRSMSNFGTQLPEMVKMKQDVSSAKTTQRLVEAQARQSEAKASLDEYQLGYLKKFADYDASFRAQYEGGEFGNPNWRMNKARDESSKAWWENLSAAHKSSVAEVEAKVAQETGLPIAEAQLKVRKALAEMESKGSKWWELLKLGMPGLKMIIDMLR